MQHADKRACKNKRIDAIWSAVCEQRKPQPRANISTRRSVFVGESRGVIIYGNHFCENSRESARTCQHIWPTALLAPCQAHYLCAVPGTLSAKPFDASGAESHGISWKWSYPWKSLLKNTASVIETLALDYGLPLLTYSSLTSRILKRSSVWNSSSTPLSWAQCHPLTEECTLLNCWGVL